MFSCGGIQGRDLLILSVFKPFLRSYFSATGRAANTTISRSWCSIDFEFIVKNLHRTRLTVLAVVRWNGRVVSCWEGPYWEEVADWKYDDLHHTQGTTEGGTATTRCGSRHPELNKDPLSCYTVTHYRGLTMTTRRRHIRSVVEWVGKVRNMEIRKLEETEGVKPKVDVTVTRKIITNGKMNTILKTSRFQLKSVKSHTWYSYHQYGLYGISVCLLLNQRTLTLCTFTSLLLFSLTIRIATMLFGKVHCNNYSKMTMVGTLIVVIKLKDSKNK